MAYVQKDMEGSLFKNDKREKDSHPHAKGSCTIGGVEYWISAWTNDGTKGKWQGLKFQPKEQKGAQQKPAGKPSKPQEDDLDVPF